MMRKLFGVLLLLVAAHLVAAAYRFVNERLTADSRPDLERQILASIEAPANRDALPNIIIILADDLGAGDLGCYGSSAIATPNLDRMAAEGMRMTQFYASAPVCSPSRAGLLTGRYPVRSGINDALLPTRSALGFGQWLTGTTRMGIPADELLLPELLRARGYRTGIVGKWHLGDRPPHLPNQNGFDFFYGVLHSNDMQPFTVFRNMSVEVPAPANQDLLTKRYTNEAVHFIEESRDQPFFLYLPHTFPHIPLHASEDFRGRSRGGLYGDTVEEIDWSVGLILDALRRLGVDERTVVFFSSDNGPWYEGSPGALRGRKRSTFDGGFRVPLLARWPGMIPAGGVTAEMAMNFDLFTTALAIAGVTLPADRIIDGQNILPVLQGRAESPHERLYFYWRQDLWAARSGAWKYHRRHEVEDINPFPWAHNEVKGPYLFDLPVDPDESYGQTESHPEVARTLSAMMDEWDLEMAHNRRGWLSMEAARD